MKHCLGEEVAPLLVVSSVDTRAASDVMAEMFVVSNFQSRVKRTVAYNVRSMESPKMESIGVAYRF